LKVEEKQGYNLAADTKKADKHVEQQKSKIQSYEITDNYDDDFENEIEEDLPEDDQV